MCFIHCTSSRCRKFVSVSSSRLVARLATVQALFSLTNQVHELHRLDGIGVSRQVILSTQPTSLYFVMMSCNTELPTFRWRLQQCAPPRTRPCCLQKSTSTSRRIASSITSRLALVSHLTSKTEWSPRRDHQPARTWLRTDETPRLHLLEGSNTYDRRLPRTLPAASV